MALSDTKLRALKPAEKPFKIFDGEGLHIHVTPSGTRSWRMSYRFDGKHQLLTFGKYPHLGLRQARVMKDEAKELLAQGLDPSRSRKEL